MKKQSRPKINAAARNVLFPRCGIVSKIPRLKSLKAVTGRKSGLRCGVVASVFSLGLERECVGRLRQRGEHQVAGQGDVDVVVRCRVYRLCVVKIVQNS